MTYIKILSKITRPRLFLTLFSIVLMGSTDPRCEALEDGEPQNEVMVDSQLQGIVNGSTVASNQFDGVVAVGGKVGICTGTLIDDKVVLTAAHCLLHGDINLLDEPSSIALFGGSRREEYLANANRVILHPFWDGTIDEESVDLALIILDDAVDDSTKYCIRQDNEYPVGTEGIIVGYGRENSAGTSGTKRFGATTILKKDRQWLEIGNPTGTCIGDSGGPLFTPFGSGNYAIVGVSSFGGPSCSPDGNAFEVNVVNYRAWIDSVVAEQTGRNLAPCWVDDEQAADDDSEMPLEQPYTSEDAGTTIEDNGESPDDERDANDDVFFYNETWCTTAGHFSTRVNPLIQFIQALI